MRVTVRVYPGSRRTSVGGRYGDSQPPVLIVRVTARAVEGDANHAVVRALADSFNLPAAAVHITSGRANRTKVVDLDGADPGRLELLFDRS